MSSENVQPERVTPPGAIIACQPGMSNEGTELSHPPSQQPVVSDKLLEVRQAIREELARHTTIHRVECVLEALYERAIGDPETKTMPSVPAIKMWLEYAVGSPAALDTGEASRALPTITKEDYERFAVIAEKYGKSIRHVHVIDTETTDE